MHLTTIYSRCWTSCLIYVFSTPRRTFHPIFTDCEMTHRQGRWDCSAEPRVPARWAALHPWGLEEFCQVSPYAVPKGTKSQPHNLLKLLIAIFPTLNSFYSELISRFSPYVIKPQGNKKKKKKPGEWRKTMVESARRKRRSRRNLSSGCHLLMNGKQTIFVIKDIIIT